MAPRFAKPSECISVPALLAGLLLFPVLQIAGVLFYEEGFLTFAVSTPLKIAVATAAPEPVDAVPPFDPARPLAIMIDDHPAARPQSGLSKADYVFEALVEGGIARLMAVYKSAAAEEIGPVRSARPYYLDWAEEFDAVYAHVGGSDEALRLLRAGEAGLDDADAFRYGETFWRDGARYAPHNTYTSTEALRALVSENGWREETDALPSDVRSEIVPDGEPARTVTIALSSGSRPTEFRYEERPGSYLRTLNGIPSDDRDGAAQAPRTVAVMELDAMKGKDPKGLGLLSMDTASGGSATVFRDGTAIAGRWEKKGGRTQFVGIDGEKIPFAPGQVWISVVSPNRGGSVSWSP